MTDHPLRDFGSRKFMDTGLLSASHDRPWQNLYAELRSHIPGEIQPPNPTQLEVTLIIKGSGCMVRRRAERWQHTKARKGTIWFCPIGVQEEEISLSEKIPEVLHIYLARDLFGQFSDVDELGPAGACRVDYLAGVEDELVRQIGFRILQELRHETAGGQMLVESLAQGLAAHLAASYSTNAPKVPVRSWAGLDARRLDRVIEFMHAHLAHPISVRELAEVACLSRPHFSRAFQAATGVAPHQYISDLRLAHAQHLLSETGMPIAQISQECQFSSQAAFSRAFLRNSGTTPSKFRRMHAIRNHLGVE